MTKGDLVLVTFPFTDLTGNKLRPALVLAVSGKDVTLSFITSQLRWKEDNDILIFPSKDNGIKKESLLKVTKIATLQINLIKGILGRIDDNIIVQVNNSLRTYLQIN